MRIKIFGIILLAGVLFNSCTNPGLKGRAYYDKITEEVKERFPEMFEDTGKKKKQTVEGSGDVDGSGKKKVKTKGFADIEGLEERDEARKACKKFIKEGLIKDEATYLKEYFMEE